jgi:hypothetical protein
VRAIGLLDKYAEIMLRIVFKWNSRFKLLLIISVTSYDPWSVVKQSPENSAFFESLANIFVLRLLLFYQKASKKVWFPINPDVIRFLLKKKVITKLLSHNGVTEISVQLTPEEKARNYITNLAQFEIDVNALRYNAKNCVEFYGPFSENVNACLNEENSFVLNKQIIFF